MLKTKAVNLATTSKTRRPAPLGRFHRCLFHVSSWMPLLRQALSCQLCYSPLFFVPFGALFSLSETVKNLCKSIKCCLTVVLEVLIVCISSPQIRLSVAIKSNTIAHQCCHTLVCIFKQHATTSKTRRPAPLGRFHRCLFHVSSWMPLLRQALSCQLCYSPLFFVPFGALFSLSETVKNLCKSIKCCLTVVLEVLIVCISSPQIRLSVAIKSNTIAHQCCHTLVCIFKQHATTSKTRRPAPLGRFHRCLFHVSSWMPLLRQALSCQLCYSPLFFVPFGALFSLSETVKNLCKSIKCCLTVVLEVLIVCIS